METQYNFYDHPLLHVDSGTEFWEESAEVSMPYGLHQIQRWYMPGIWIQHLKSQFKSSYTFYKENPGEGVSLSFNLKGRYAIQQRGHTYTVQAGQHNLIYTQGASNTFENLDTEGESLGIVMSPSTFLDMAQNGNDTLKFFLDRMQSGGPVVLSPKSLQIFPELERAIHELLYCPFSGKMKQLYMLSKCIEILVLQAEDYHLSVQAPRAFIPDPWAKPMLEARDYLNKNLSRPPSLSELSKIIGVNEYTLKKEFKRHVGFTVFAYITEKRLQKACLSLRETNQSIGEIGLDLGYSSSQHFSQAFKKKFGLSPRSYREGL